MDSNKKGWVAKFGEIIGSIIGSIILFFVAICTVIGKIMWDYIGKETSTKQTTTKKKKINTKKK